MGHHCWPLSLAYKFWLTFRMSHLCICKSNILRRFRSVKYCNFTEFLGAESLWKHTVSAEFLAHFPKLYENCVLSQKFHTRKLGEVTAMFWFNFKGDSNAAQNMKFLINNLFSKCDQIQRLVTFTKEIINAKLHFFNSVMFNHVP